MTDSRLVEFEGVGGEVLAGRLDLPAGAPRGHALFAHCFTYGKDAFAASRISRALTEHGVAVLRFDFTGLRESGGDFAGPPSPPTGPTSSGPPTTCGPRQPRLPCSSVTPSAAPRCWRPPQVSPRCAPW
jgi:hypothetical protein